MPRVRTPDIYWDYTARRVLTMEWIEGVKLTNQVCVWARGGLAVCWVWVPGVLQLCHAGCMRARTMDIPAAPPPPVGTLGLGFGSHRPHPAPGPHPHTGGHG